METATDQTEHIPGKTPIGLEESLLTETMLLSCLSEVASAARVMSSLLQTSRYRNLVCTK